MSDDSIAGGESVTVVTLPADAPQAMTASEAGRYLAASRRPKEAAPVEQPQADPVEPPPELNNAHPEGDDPVDTPEEVEPEASLPPLDAPRSWTKEAKDRWNALPREAQEEIARVEQSREREFRRSQNEAADIRKAAEAERQQAEQERKKYEGQLPVLMQSLQDAQQSTFADIKTMADVEKLANEDPFRFQQWQVQQMRLQSVNAALEESKRNEATQRQSKRAAYEAEQNTLLTELVPEMAEPKKAAELRDRAVKMLTDDLGLKNEQLSRWMQDDTGHEILSNAGIQKLIADGLKYRDILNAPKAVASKPVPPVQRPGVARAPNANAAQSIRALEQQLEKASGNQAMRLGAQLLAAQRAASMRK